MSLSRKTFHPFVTALLLLAWGLGGEPGPGKRISGFGSSVCNGQGDEQSRGGYMGRLGARLLPKGWLVTNASRGGDNTLTIQERWDPSSPKRSNLILRPSHFLLPTAPDFVFVGLSLNNEGLTQAKGEEADAAVADQWNRGMMGIFARLRASNIIPVMGNCYANNYFSADDYASTLAMNRRVHDWDVPSAHFLGALDDGKGRWGEGFFYDGGHPNSAGYTELMESIVPSLFEALLAGKKRPVKPAIPGALRVPAGSTGGLSCEPEFPLHAFSLAFQFNAESDATLVELSTQPQSKVLREVVAGKSNRIKVCEFAPEGEPTALSVQWRGGKLIFNGLEIPGSIPEAGWHALAITGRPSAGFIKVYLDGRELSTLRESRFLASFRLAPRPAGDVGLRELFLYRSALNDGEIKALTGGALLQSSLDLYAPMAEKSDLDGLPPNNLAQSMTTLKVAAKGIRAIPYP